MTGTRRPRMREVSPQLGPTEKRASCPSKMIRPLDLQTTLITRLGRAVRASVHRSKDTSTAHEQQSTNNSLRDVILGGQDGLVNMLGIALGVVAAGGSTHVLVVTGIAPAITESISMGAAYTSFGSGSFYITLVQLEMGFQCPLGYPVQAAKVELPRVVRAFNHFSSRFF